MPIYQGSNKINDITDGSTDIQEVYAGSDLVWSAGPQSRVYVAANNSQMEVFEPDGTSAWHKNYSDGNTLRIATNPSGEIVAGYQYNLVRKLDANGNELWTENTDNNVRGIAFGPNGNIYYGTDDGWIYRLDSSGNQDWQRDFIDGDSTDIYDLAADTHGYLHVVTGGSSFCYRGMVNLSDGSGVYKVGSSGANWRGLAVDSTNYMIYTTNASDNSLNAFSYDSSGWNYQYDYTDFNKTPTQVVVDGQGKLYVSCWDDNFHVVEDTGSSLTNVQITTCVDGRGAGVAPDNYFYGGDSWNNKVTCWNSSGSQEWESTLTDYSSVRRMAIEPGRYGTFPNDW